MSISLKPGTRLFSRVGLAELIVVKAPGDELELTLGGHPPALAAEDRGEPLAPLDGREGGVEMGKRYTDEAGTVELLCTKPGDGAPALDGLLLGTKQAKALPASD